jgi:MFS family permease
MDSGPLTEPLPPSDAASGDSAYAVLRNRDFSLYLIARFIAALGQQMLTVAVLWELYERTHRPLALGLVGLTQMVPMILLILPAGHVADNYDRKRTILGMVFLAFLSSAGLTLISARGAGVIWIYCCLFGAGVARTFLWPASQAFLPQLVPRRIFSRAVTWNTGAFHLSSVLGPAAGGALISLTHKAAVVYAINAVATLICLGLIALVRSRHVVVARQEVSLTSLLAGFRFVYNTKIILGTITLDLFAVLLGGATALLPVYAKDILNSGPTGLGILQAALPLGSVVSAFYLAHRPPLQQAGRALMRAVTAFGLATVAFGLSSWFWFSFAMLFICGAVDNVSVVVRHTLVQLLTPDEMRGRVSAVNSLFIGTSNELGGFESGFVAQFLGPVFSVVSGGVGTIIVVIAIGLIWPEIRKYGRLDGSG